jgi:hypothetical protein
VLLGWVVGATCCEHAQRSALARATARFLAAGAQAEARRTTWLPCARELRAVEGVGATRAVDLARWFWQESGSPGGPWKRLEDAPGVGPTLRERIQAELRPRAPPHAS